ncbi:NAD(P)-binding protein [Lentinus tigrinus ALCF2SS1-7]|uniref:NAD(P)-binding protein n=1 Tax=Lentinus tigrinus ALCF2SS1-6 TaxID=1328759 RepID=A0A5C2S524_9APHY|nr:NAD(P)-binding protein [Lentinus tigrinus ALCF2SS1-6]RPD72247.1 NAD(P)-binding protein [Lentinus tigrinus ALCF2SS1-7]
MSSPKPLVLVLGATGTTGGSIIKGLLASGNFRIAALIRPASASKAATEKLRSAGIDIRLGDVEDSVEKHKETLAGVDILISAVIATVIAQQKNIILAAQQAGVKRVIPCDFGTPGARGVRELHDQKLAIREFIKQHGIPHTFIDVGWWMQIYLPIPLRSTAPPEFKSMTHRIVGSGDTPILLTNNNHIGTFVARIIADPRTLDHEVIIWEDQASQLDAQEIGARLSGEGQKLKELYVNITAKEVLQAAAAAKERVTRDPSDWTGHVMQSWNEYLYSMHILHENTLENAKRLGYLDARELYPDIATTTLEECAKEFYAMEEPAEAYGYNRK